MLKNQNRHTAHVAKSQLKNIALAISSINHRSTRNEMIRLKVETIIFHVKGTNNIHYAPEVPKFEITGNKLCKGRKFVREGVTDEMGMVYEFLFEEDKVILIDNKVVTLIWKVDDDNYDLYLAQLKSQHRSNYIASFMKLEE